MFIKLYLDKVNMVLKIDFFALINNILLIYNIFIKISYIFNMLIYCIQTLNKFNKGTNADNEYWYFITLCVSK